MNTSCNGSVGLDPDPLTRQRMRMRAPCRTAATVSIPLVAAFSAPPRSRRTLIMSDRVIYYKAIAVLPKHMHVEVSCSTHRCTSRQQQSQSEDPIPTLPQTCCVQFILVLHDAQHCPGFAGMEQGAALSWPQQSTKHGATDQPWCMFRARPTPNTNKHPAAPRLQAQQHNNRRHQPLMLTL